MKLRAVAALIILATLTACSPDDGTVIGKEYREGYWYMTTVTVPCGKSVCSHPQPQYMPECYRLILDTGNRCVGRDEYDATEIGAHWHEGDYQERVR